MFDVSYPALTAELYRRLLELLPRLVDRLDEFRSLWEDEDRKLTASETLIDKGLVTIAERPELDLAIVRLPEDLAAEHVHRLTQPALAECHPFAIHTRTRCSRLLLVQGSKAEVHYRYEGWVQMATRRPALRVDLSPLADELNEAEGAIEKWMFDHVDAITPRLHLKGDGQTSLSPDFIQRRLEHHLRTGAPAWNPYD
jgi:hypothetical protein